MTTIAFIHLQVSLCTDALIASSFESSKNWGSSRTCTRRGRSRTVHLACAEPPRFGPAPLHRGERTTCPGCGEGSSRGTWANRYKQTGPTKGALCASWWARFWRRCKERRNHYHQRCLDCGARWIVGFLEEIE